MEQLDFLLDQESEPSTVHEGSYRIYRGQFLEYYRDIFSPSCGHSKLGKILELRGEQFLRSTLAPALSAAGLPEADIEDIKRSLPLDEPDHNALQIMAGTSAHCQSK